MSELFKKPTELTEQYLQKTEAHADIASTESTPRPNRLRRMMGGLMLGLGIFGAGAGVGAAANEIAAGHGTKSTNVEDYTRIAPIEELTPNDADSSYLIPKQTEQTPDIATITPDVNPSEAIPNTGGNNTEMPVQLPTQGTIDDYFNLPRTVTPHTHPGNPGVSQSDSETETSTVGETTIEQTQ